MKLLFDFLPLILFFIAFKAFNVYVATAVAIVISIAQIAFLAITRRPISGMQWSSVGIIIVFGGATLLLHDPVFIKWKPTIFYWVLTLALLVSQFAFKRNLIQKLMQQQFALKQNLWTILNLAWTLFFLLLGFLNIYIAENFSLDTWVTFKVFGVLVLMIVFVVIQTILISKYMIAPQKNENSYPLEK